MQQEFLREGNKLTYDLIIEEDEEELKETVNSFKESIEKEIREAETLISSNIKNAVSSLEKEINDKQLARNRSIVLEILDTISSFESAIRQKFAGWRNDDAALFK
jgi:molecular chaperone GrpE (heat shock protein)